ncbi:MAG TPA: outer membrane beta-barrel protein, partial [Blastocatellia bacterium]|nr:outer membrane beta-barrel protein [Blastocatellia bacterium]
MNNRKRFCFPMLLLLIFVSSPAVFAQEHELALLVGRLKASDSTLNSVGQVKAAFDGAVTYQINYANRMVNGELASLHWELAIAGAPRTGVRSSNVLLPRTYSTLIFTPGLKLKIFPGGGFSPYLAGGVGLGRFSQSGTNINGSPNTGDRSNTSFVFNYGGGVDLNVLGPISVRGEARDFMTGNPSFSTPFLNDRKHNLFVGAGIV